MWFIKSKKAIAMGAESLRKIKSDDKTKTLAIVGTVEDLMKVGILEECNAPKDWWCCLPNIPSDHPYSGAGFGSERIHAIRNANDFHGIGEDFGFFSDYDPANDEVTNA